MYAYIIDGGSISDIIIAGLCKIIDTDKYFKKLLDAINTLNTNDRKDTTKKILTLLRLRPILYTKIENKIKETNMPLTLAMESDPYFTRCKEEGWLESKIEMVIKMYEMGDPINKISLITGLSSNKLSDILKL